MKTANGAGGTARNGRSSRDRLYWVIFKNVRNKYPGYSVNQMHAVASALRGRAEHAASSRTFESA